MLASVAGKVLGMNAAEIAHAAAAVLDGIGIQDLPPITKVRHAGPIAKPRHWREIADYGHAVFGCLPFRKKLTTLDS